MNKGNYDHYYKLLSSAFALSIQVTTAAQMYLKSAWHMSRLAEYPHGHKMSDKLRQNKKSLKQNCFYISMLYTQAHT